MTRGYFITGTDTDVGKTWSTLALIEHFKQQGFSVAGMKPVSAGCVWREDGWRNADALALQAHSSFDLPYQLVNPYAFEQAVSPHLACGETLVAIDEIKQNYWKIAEQADVVLVEGAGGWYSPLSPSFNNADLATQLDLPVILVVGIRLGCINHALLTDKAIAADGRRCIGWIASCIDAEMPYRQQNIELLQSRLMAPLLAVLPHQTAPDFADLGQLINF